VSSPKVTFEVIGKKLGAYKEIIGATIVIGGTAFGVLDYFATKREVRLLECRQTAQITSMQSEQKVRELTAAYLAAKLQALDLHDQENQKVERPIADLRRIQMAAIAKEKEADDLAKERDAETAAQREQHEYLKPGKCEKAIDEAPKKPAASGEGK
jgi:hypothetical protein